MSWITEHAAAVFEAASEGWSATVDPERGAAVLFKSDGSEAVRFAAGASYPSAPFAARIDGAWHGLGAPDGTLLEHGRLTLSWREPEATVTVEADPAFGLNLRLHVPDADAVAIALVASSDEHFYGLGERFNKLDQRGDVVELWVKNGASGGETYKPVPFIASSHGYGLAVDTSRRVFAALAHGTTPDVSTITVEGAEIDIWLIPGPTPVDVVRRYTAWVGRPPVPPAWFFRPWKSRDWRFEDQQTVMEDIIRQQEHGIPCGVKLIDAGWETEGHSFVFNTEKYPDVAGMIGALQEAGMELVLWFSPSMTAGSEDYDEAARRGYLITDAEGKPYLHRLGNEPGWEGTTIDFSNPEAVAWWQTGIRSLLELGVRGFKTDFGEQVPEDARFANGKTGAEMHNMLPVLYNEATWDVVREYDGVLLGRSAWAGSQPFPGIWAGDQSADFSPWGGLPTAIVAGQSAGWSGFPYWGSDVGGYFNPPDDEVFARWAEFGAVSPVMEAHGLGKREAWEFSPETLAIYRHYARLHDQLVPYSLAAAREASESGLPIMRAMALLYPDRAEAHEDWVQYQFMYGPSLLAAPVYSWGKQRQIWFPPGEWIDIDTGETFGGPLVTRVPAPIDKLPLYARSGAAIPLALDPESEDLALLQFVGEDPAPVSLRMLDGTVIAFAPRGATSGVLLVSGPARRYRLQVPFVHAAAARIDGVELPVNAEGAAFTGPAEIDLEWSR